MNASLVFLRLERATEQVTLTKEEANAVASQLNYLERFIAKLLGSLKKRAKVIDVEVPYRTKV